MQKIVIFTYPAFIFCLPWGRRCGNHAKRCMNEKTIQCLSNPSQHVPICLQQFPSYSNRKCKKIAVFTYRSPHFCFSWRRPCDYHAICCTDGKTIQRLPNSSQHVPIYLQQFPSYSNRKCKKSPFSRTTAHIFVSPGDAPAIIMQYVAWIEGQFNAYQTPHSMYTVPIYTVFQKNVTTFSMIRVSWSRTIRLQRFLAHYYQVYRPSTGTFSFPPHLFRAATLPWETVET